MDRVWCEMDCNFPTVSIPSSPSWFRLRKSLAGMSNFSPRENRFYEISLRECGREILPSKSPNGREKRHSPLKISLGEFKGRISLQNLPSEERKYFLGRILNLPSKFKIEKTLFDRLRSIWPILYGIFIKFLISDGLSSVRSVQLLRFKISIQIFKIWIF